LPDPLLAPPLPPPAVFPLLQQPLPYPAALPMPHQRRPPADCSLPECWHFAFNLFDHNWPVYYMGKMEVQCPDCGALH
jgi:hypothetical protein